MFVNLKIAVIILNWNGIKLLKQFIPVIVKYLSNNTSIYIIDNDSTDTSINFINQHYPYIKIIKNKYNKGYAKGYNEGLKQVKADIFCLLNSDIEVSKGWLKPVINIFNKYKNTAIIQPKILDFKNKQKFEYAGAGGGFIDFFGYPFCRGRIFNSIENDEGQYNDTKNIFWASGACFFIRSKVFFDSGGFDEDFFAHQEEIDLCWRVKNQGYNVKYVGNSTVYHIGGATLKESNPRKTYLNFRNSLFTLLKNVPRKKLFFTILFRLFLDGIAGIKFTLELRPIHTLSIIKAHFSFYKNIIKFSKKRKSLKKNIKYNKTTSIVWSYFIMRIKKYDKLSSK